MLGVRFGSRTALEYLPTECSSMPNEQEPESDLIIVFIIVCTACGSFF